MIIALCPSTLMMAPGSASGLLCVLVLVLLRGGDTKFHDECDYSANYKCGDVCDRRYYDCQLKLETKVPEDFTITEKAPTSAFTFKTLLRPYAKQMLTPWYKYRVF